MNDRVFRAVVRVRSENPRRLLIGGLLFLLAIGGCLWRSCEAKPPRGLSVTFKGYTNDGSGIVCARFGLSNESQEHAEIWPSLEFLPRDQPVAYEAYFSRVALVLPGSARREIVAALPSALQGPWRARVTVYEERGWLTRKVRAARDRFRRLGRGVPVVDPDEDFNSFYSEEVQPP